MSTNQINIESHFNIDELFFSTTDKKGIIDSFNQVFVRVSEYSKDELSHRPHNMIRHPDMPKSVFKLLWCEISNGNPLCAYVKNMSKSGKYYWVYAMAFPIADGYLSIRLKPSTALLAQVDALYKKMLATEKSKSDKNAGMEASTQLLVDSLNSLGFQNYKQFMEYSLIEELNNREITLRNNNTLLTVNSFKNNLPLTSIVLKCFKNATDVFNTVVSFDHSVKIFKDVSTLIKNTSLEASLFTINLSISADKLGQTGQVLSVVSTGFSNLAQEIENGVTSLLKSLETLTTEHKNMKFLAAISKFQIEMLAVFLKDLQSPNIDGSYSDNEKEQFNKNARHLKTLVENNILQIEKQIQNFRDTFANLSRSINELSTIITGMDVIKISGRIEISRLNEAEHSLNNHVESMSKLNEIFKISLQKIYDESENAQHQFKDVHSKTNHVKFEIAQMAEHLN
jgi:PAS domain S-box-containing protein